MTVTRAIAVGVAAVAAAALLGLALGHDAGTVAATVGLALVGALAAEGLGALLLDRLRSRTMRAQALVVALTPVVATFAGAALAARVMLLSAPDFGVLVVILGTAGTVAVVSGVMVADRLAVASRSLESMARSLGNGSPGPLPEDPPELAAELTAVREELEATSARLEESRDEAAALESARRELVSWVSHDLRTPIADVRVLVEALEDQVVDDPATVARYLETIRERADRLGALVDDLFELSRIHAGSLRLSPERVALADLVSDTLASLGPVAEARGVRLEGHVAGPGPEVEVSLPEIMRVLHNLLDNALRHTPPGGLVLIEAAAEGPWASVGVLDSCGGIPPAELDRVFEVAYRGDAARSATTAGGGLGLAIARGFVEAHGGEADVGNVEGGCRFVVRLPRVAVVP